MPEGIEGLSFRDTSVPNSLGGQPFVVIIDNVVSSKLADSIFYAMINAYASKRLHSVYAEDGVSARVDTNSRYTHSYPTELVPNRLEVIDAMQRAVASSIARKYPGRQVSSAVRPQVLGYEERCMFQNHCDNSILVNGRWVRNDPMRDLTGILYLSDHSEFVTKANQYSGGELVFNNIVDSNAYPIELRPKKGSLVLFPSCPAYQHQVRIVKSGYRIAMVDWWALV